MGYWEDAVKDITAFNKAYAQLERKPTDPTALKRCLSAANKAVKFAVWANRAFPGYDDGLLLKAWRGVYSLVKAKATDPDEIRTVIERFKDAVQDTLDATAPTVFTYEGFKVVNPERLSDDSCRKTLQGIDVLIALFKKRGVDKAVLDDAISRVILGYDSEGGGDATYNSGSREMFLSVAALTTEKPTRFLDSRAGEAVIHEIGHYVHLNFIKGEAKAAWNDPWQGVADLADTRNRYLDEPAKAQRDTKLDELGIPTDYGKTNEREDFAETFLLFIVDPQRLSPTATFRMQRALSLSGLYGKPVMHLAQRVVVRFLRTASRLSLGPGRLDQSASASLKKVKLKAKYTPGDMTEAIISAGYYAQKRKKTMFVYGGNSFGHAVWRVSDKASDYLNPINNTGAKVVEVTPDLDVIFHDVQGQVTES